ncbi:MAG: hypothetical protein AB1347_11340 [Acidobacteriota bacterium]
MKARGVRFSLGVLGIWVLGAWLCLGCCACRKKLDPSNDAEYEKARVRAERVATDIMDSISAFEKKGPHLTLIEWNLEAMKKRGYRVSYQPGILTLRTFNKRWDLYFFSLGTSFQPALQEGGKVLLIKIRPFPPEPDPTVIIDHGEYMLSLIEDHIHTWDWYLTPRPPLGYFPQLVGWPGEYELREGSKRKMADYRE